MSRYHCEWINKGLFLTHRGSSLCCNNLQIEKPSQLPSEFWYGQTRKQAVTNSKNGQPVQGCDVCYIKEKNKHFSTRNTYERYKKYEQKDTPVMLDLDLSNLCNLKCVMCSHHRSSEWAKEQSKYVDTNGVSKLDRTYIDDLINISANVQDLYIQGGEPSIMEEYIYFFSLLDKHGYSKNIDLTIISNATNLNKKFSQALKNFKTVTMQISVDSYGMANNYIRWPSKFTTIENNIFSVIEDKNYSKLNINCAINILSMFNYFDFLMWCKQLEDRSIANGKDFSLICDKIFNPIYYSPFIADHTLKLHFENEVKNFMKNNKFIKNKNFAIEMGLFLKSLSQSKTNIPAIQQLLQMVKKLDLQRNTKIENYIPNFYQYFTKSQ